MNESARQTTLSALAEIVGGIRLGHPIRVAVDGRTAAGKTSLADELAENLSRRETIRASLDNFHHPSSRRYQRGRESAVGYYEDARNYTAARALLLDPLGAGGNRTYRVANFDVASDRPVAQPPELAAVDAILIVDGTFLQRPQLAGAFDLVIFVHVDALTALARGVERDTEFLGGRDRAEHLHVHRYGAAFDLYERECNPKDRAHVVIDNSRFDRPILSIRCCQAGRTLWPIKMLRVCQHRLTERRFNKRSSGAI